MGFRLEDIRIEYFKSSGPGGQHKNKKLTAVRITHLPTGIKVVSARERSQLRNKEIALLVLRERVSLAGKRKKPRIITKTPRYVKEKILETKRMHSEKKKQRRRVNVDVDS